jgi:3-phenylpropionate/trans-cinnamate dioxygenase ferredoxin reductase component
MLAERIVIVGGAPAGLATARSYREHGGQGTVTLIGAEPVLPYRPPAVEQGVPARRAGRRRAGDRARVLVHDNHVQLRLGIAASAIDAEHGTVTVAGDERLPADAIVLAIGDVACAENASAGSRVLTHECDTDYERGRELISQREPAP